MIPAIGRRLVAMVGVLAALVLVMFLLQRFTPADPVRTLLGSGASRQQVALARHNLGYDRPLYVQYFRYLKNVLHGNLQTSVLTRNPVRSDLASFLPATIELTIASIFFALFFGALLGVLSALRTRAAGVVRLLLVAGASAPSFVVAELGIILFYRELHWLPASGQLSGTAPSGPTKLVVLDSLLHLKFGLAWDGVLHLILPAICIGLLPAVAIGRVLRSSLLTTMAADYIRTARAKGLARGALIWRHALRNSVGPALSMTGLQMGMMFAGVVIIETIFAWPGVGSYTAQAIPADDFPAISGVTLVLGMAYVVINAVVDILQTVIDPRIAL